MKYILVTSAIVQLVLAALLACTEAHDLYKLCPRGNITVFSPGRQVLISPDRCFPTPIVQRSQLHPKPIIQLATSDPPGRFAYTALMLELNRTLDRYDVHWLETNLTVNNSYILMRNMSPSWDVTKMIEYRPPKQATYNLTYIFLVFRQSYIPVEVPRIFGSTFRPNIWAANSHLTLVGGVEFLVGGTWSGGNQPALLPSPNVNNFYSVNRTQYGFGNYSNHTYPRPPPYNPHYYPPQPQPPYYPPQPQPPHYPPQPYPPHYPPRGNGRHRGGAAAIHATVYLTILFAFLPFVLNT